jgi:hypothetical protein
LKSARTTFAHPNRLYEPDLIVVPRVTIAGAKQLHIPPSGGEAVIDRSRMVRTIIHCASARAVDPLGSRLVLRLGLLLIRRGGAS